jgi:hypothetical protein
LPDAGSVFIADAKVTVISERTGEARFPYRAKISIHENHH